MNEKILVRLTEQKDYDVAGDQPDIRGWDLIGPEGIHFGKVKDLFFEKELMKVRYADVELNKDFRVEGMGDRILIPIGMAALHEEDKNLFVDKLTRDTVRDWPVYSGDEVERSYEDSLRNKIFSDKKDWTPVSTKGYYDYAYYDDSTFRGSRSRV